VTVRHYSSTDVGAPPLTGVTGQWSALAAATLVNGYPGHPAAGWSLPFGVSHVLRQGAGSDQFYYRLVEGANSSGLYVAGRGYEAMSTEPGTGLYWFPPTGPGPARRWHVFADERTAYVFVDFGPGSTGWNALLLGEYYAFDAAPRALFISYAAAHRLNTWFPPTGRNPLTEPLGEHWLARDHLGTVGAVIAGKHGDNGKSWNSPDMRGVLPYPNPGGPGSKKFISPIYLHDPAVPTVRGVLRGLYQWLHEPNVVADGDTFDGDEQWAGRSFTLLNPTANGAGVWCIEHSNTWDTNA
jgi:hypothetical protein